MNINEVCLTLVRHAARSTYYTICVDKRVDQLARLGSLVCTANQMATHVNLTNETVKAMQCLHCIVPLHTSRL